MCPLILRRSYVALTTPPMSYHSPHNGLNIPFFQLIHALRSVYRLSYPLAYLLTIAGFLLCGHLEGAGLSTRLKLDLHDLARHNRIEHNGSLGHADATPGDKYAPSVPDRKLIAQLLEGAYQPPLTASIQSGRVRQPVKVEPRTMLNFDDIAHARYIRDSQMDKKLDPLHAEIARGEAALLMETFSDSNGDIPREWVKRWFEEERLPDGWVGPREQIGLFRTASIGKRVKAETEKLQRLS